MLNIIVIREIQIKPGTHHFTPAGVAKIKKTTASAGEGMETLEFSCVAERNVKWRSHLGKQFDSSLGQEM